MPVQSTLFGTDYSFIYAVYPISLDSVAVDVSKVKLDAITVAKSLSLDIQKELAQFAPFAQHAYNITNDGSFFRGLFKSEPKEVDITRNRFCKTRARWLQHIVDLQRFDVLIQLTVAPMGVVSRYFAVPKSNGLARSIFSGGHLSRLCLRPPGVNLPMLPQMLRIMAALCTKGQIYILLGDLRHYFHQIEISPDISRFFSIFCCNVMYGYAVLPMGFSYSPRIAQCFAWAALLSLASTKNGLSRAASEIKGVFDHPPSFVMLHDENNVECGVVFIWYDNFTVCCLSKSMTVELSKTFSDMQTKYKMQWGSKNLFHPTHLNKNSEDKPCAVLGLQLAVVQIRARDAQGPALIWRLKPDTAKKAETMMQELTLNRTSIGCKSVAGIIGSAVWQCYSRCEPLTKIHDGLMIASEAGKLAAKSGWNAKLSLSEEQHTTLSNLLNTIKRNPWTDPQVFHTEGEIRIVSTDAALRFGCYTWILSDSIRKDWDNWEWSTDESLESIFLLELRAAVRAILALAPRHGTLVIIIDNTSAAAVLRKWYSSTRKGRELADVAWKHLNDIGCSLVVAGIASEDNDADSGTRTDTCRFVKDPETKWSSHRLRASWETATRELKGIGRKGFNPKTCPVSHWVEETELRNDEDDDECEFENANSEVTNLMTETAL